MSCFRGWSWVVAVFSAVAASGQAIYFDHVYPEEFAIHIERLAGEDEEPSIILIAFYDDYRKSLHALGDNRRFVQMWAVRYQEEDIRFFGSWEWPLKLLPVQMRDGLDNHFDSLAEGSQGGYFDDLHALFPDDEDVINGLKRMRFRQKILASRSIQYAGTTPDLIMLMRETAPNASSQETIAAILSRYGLQMDSLLRSAWPYFDTSSAERRRYREEDDVKGMADSVENEFRLRIRMRQLNQRTAAALVPLLPLDERNEFEEALLDRSYPQADPGSTSWTIRHLLTLPGLTTSERAQLEKMLADTFDNRDSLLPELRERYDALFERKGVREYAELRARLWLGHIEYTEAGQIPWSMWRSWLEPLHDATNALRPRVDEIALALNDREGVTATGPPPEQEAPDVNEAAWNPSVEFQDIDHAVDILQLDPEESQILRDLHRQHRHIVRTESLSSRLQFQSAGSSVRGVSREENPEAWLEVAATRRDLQDRWIEFRAEQELAFRDEVKALLAVDDRATWDGLMEVWTRRRKAQFVSDRIGGRLVYDLSLMVADAALRPEVEEVIASYLAKLDELLDSAERSYATLYYEFMLGYYNDGPLSDQRFAAQQANSAPGRAIGDFNEETADHLLAILTETESHILTRALWQQRYPGIYHETPVERYAQLIADRPELAPKAQETALTELLNTSSEQQSVMRLRLVEAMKAWAAPGMAAKLRQRRRELVEEGRREVEIYEEHPSLPLFLQDTARVRRTMQTVRALYDDDDFTELPPEVKILMLWW